MTPSPSVGWFRQIQGQIEAAPRPQTEESQLFRVLVQLMVIVGIVATDIAAQTNWSIWAIPLSIIGAISSWHRRHQRNITLKFVLAIAMLGVLFAFLSNLVVNLNDSRIALAGLLVQLQVLHSFDLPRRKDLGYSMVIGLILLGVAGTVSQTMTFAPWLVLFLAVALPALVLDYRSRLGLEAIDRRLGWFSPKTQSPAKGANGRYSPLRPKRLAVILALTLGLGLVLFTLMPRLPSYQLQTFPVSGPESTKNQEFDSENQTIINPGYVNPGRGGEGGGSGTSPVQGQGALDDTVYYGFNSRINQNLRGEMTKQLVLRVRSQAEGFWRALAFDHYTGQGWEISNNDDISKIRRSPWSYRFNLDSTTSQIPTRSVIQTYTAVMDLPNVIPNLYSAKYLYFPTKEVGLDRNGSLRSPVGLVEGLTYTVISNVPYRDRTLLRQASPNYRPGIQKKYLQLDPEVKARVRETAIALLQKSPNRLDSVYEISLYLAQSLKQNYRILTDIPFLEPEEDLVETFLYRDQGGYPDHFSTVLTVMLRSLDIPARFTVGFAPGQFNPFTGYYLVHNTDAFGLTEVYFPNMGWYTFDPIPGHPLFPPSIEDSETFSVLKQLWSWIAGWLPSPIANFVSLLWTKSIEAFLSLLGGLWQLVSGSFLGALLGLILAITVGFVSWLGWNQARRWLRQRYLAHFHPLARLYQILLISLKEQGYGKAAAQTPGEYSQSLREHLEVEQWKLVDEIICAYVAWRYGEKAQNIDYLQQQLQQLTRSFRRQANKKLLTFKVR